MITRPTVFMTEQIELHGVHVGTKLTRYPSGLHFSRVNFQSLNIFVFISHKFLVARHYK
jgi:hypothetical protein